jgi:drug/metabolite transporter (DMT)-like permease
MTFCFSPILQLTGLSTSHAIDNAIIVALEPLMTIFLAWAFLREKLSLRHVVALVLALIGFSLLSGLKPAQLTQGLDSHLVGNLIMLTSLSGEASYSILGRKFVSTLKPFVVFLVAMAAGVLILTSIAFTFAGPPALGHLTWKSGVAFLVMGPLGTAACYLYWVQVLVEVPVTTIAITLFVQPVMGSLWGFLLLGDRLSSIQAVGGALILAAVFTQLRAEKSGQ